MSLHIVQRGHDLNTVFVQQADYAYYLENLRQVKSDLHIKAFGHCLMTDNAHLLVALNDDVNSISRVMKILAARQSRYANKLEKHSGTLWGAFQSESD